MSGPLSGSGTRDEPSDKSKLQDAVRAVVLWADYLDDQNGRQASLDRTMHEVELREHAIRLCREAIPTPREQRYADIFKARFAGDWWGLDAVMRTQFRNAFNDLLDTKAP